jgi:hypothetical protein
MAKPETPVKIYREGVNCPGLVITFLDGQPWRLRKQFFAFTEVLRRHGRLLSGPLSHPLGDKLHYVSTWEPNGPRGCFYYGFDEQDGRPVAVILHGALAHNSGERKQALRELCAYRTDPVAHGMDA